MKTLQQLRTELRDALGAVKEFEESDFLDDDGNDRDMTADEQKNYDALADKAESLIKQVKQRERAERLKAENAGDAIDPEGETKDVKVPAQARKEPGKFSNFGEQLQAIANKAMGGGNDNRLVWERSAGANEAIPSEGGFLVQTDFSTRLFDLMHDMGQILSRVNKESLSTNANGVDLPMVDETSRANGSRFGGIQAYWANEGETVTASKPKLRNIELRLNKLMGIMYATDELLQDAGLLDSIATKGFSEEMVFKAEDAIVNGDGSGKMLGFMNSGALVSVAKEGSQVADTVVTENILKMANRLPTRSMNNAVWLVNQDVLPQLWPMTIGDAAAGAMMFQPAGLSPNSANAPFGTLLGRPVLPVEYMATVGDLGDIVLVDLGQYIMIDKGGVDANQSMHVRFLTDEQTFKFTYRLDGQPTWHQAVTPFNGTNTLSPYVTLAERA